MKRMIWILLLLLGAGLLLAPVLSGLYHVWLENWDLLDWLLLYSYVFWPTYIVGVLLVVPAVWQLCRAHRN